MYESRPPVQSSSQPRPVKVFMSYRRAEDDNMIGRIEDHLVHRYGRPNVFRDIDSIPGAVDFLTAITQTLREADVVLAIIGPQWAVPRHGSDRDWVHTELERALEQGLPVVPVLLGGTSMPSQQELPEAISGLLRLNAVPVEGGTRFASDIAKLLDVVDTEAQVFRTGQEIRRRAPGPPPTPTETARVRSGTLVPPLAELRAPIHERRTRAGWLIGLLVLAGVAAAALVIAIVMSRRDPPVDGGGGGSVDATTGSAASQDNSCRVEISNPFTELHEQPEPDSQTYGGVPSGTYPVRDSATSDFAGANIRFFEIQVGSNVGWVEDDIVFLTKSGDC